MLSGVATSQLQTSEFAFYSSLKFLIFTATKQITSFPPFQYLFFLLFLICPLSTHTLIFVICSFHLLNE